MSTWLIFAWFGLMWLVILQWFAMAGWKVDYPGMDEWYPRLIMRVMMTVQVVGPIAILLNVWLRR